MNSILFITSIFASILVTSVSTSRLPHFFPNASSIPPSLLPTSIDGAWTSFQKFNGCHAGQNVDGLVRLKKYFQYFGYINTTSTNFTNDFDDDLEEAIKIYQLNYNLNTTGELDAPTLNQLVRPRCGNADVVNGTSSMNSGKRPASHIHAVAHYSFFPNTPRWSKTDLTYAFLPENQIPDNVKAVFARAFARWAEVIPMTFNETASLNVADIRIGFFSGEHGDGEPFDGVLGTLAHAFSPPSGRLHLDNDEDWVIDGAALTNVASVDLESVAVHEIGHLLGLGHSSVEEAIMFPTISTGSRRVVLATDDIQGIQELYGSNPTFNGSTTSTNQERDTSGSGSRFVGQLWSLRLRVLLAVGLGLLIS